MLAMALPTARQLGNDVLSGFTVHRRLVGCFAMVLAALLVPLTASAAELTGSVELIGRGIKPEHVAQAVVYFTPLSPVDVRPEERPFEMVTVRKQFLPRVLAVQAGSTIRFPNEDPILHNVFSLSPGNRFDLGLYRQGEGKEHTFAEPGLVRVFCNVHHDMVAYIMVLDTPYYTAPGRDGRFRLFGLPEVPGTITVWHERSEPWSQTLRLPHATPLTVQLEASKPEVPKHLNKLGKPYKRRRRAY